MLPGSVGHPPESHHGQGDHLSRGLFVSGVDVVLNFHRVSGHHCQGSIDSSKIMHPFLQSSFATGGTVWIVPSSNKIFQWSRAFLTTAAPICYNHAYISKQQLFCSKSASLPIAKKKICLKSSQAASEPSQERSRSIFIWKLRQCKVLRHKEGQVCGNTRYQSLLGKWRSLRICTGIQEIENQQQTSSHIFLFTVDMNQVLQV